MTKTDSSPSAPADRLNPDGPILIVSMVRNEADIIEATVRHNLAYADHIHFVDDSSSDGTCDILQALADETGRISVEHHDGLGFEKGKLIKGVAAREGRSRQAGHILLLDADEALIGDPTAFRTKLLHADMPLLLPWTTYVPTAKDAAHSNPLVRIRHRRKTEAPQLFKRTIPHRLIGKVWFDNGYHWMRSDGKEVPADADHPFRIAHFPVRSPEQLAAKVLIGNWNYRLNPSRPPSNGKHWRAMATKILTNGMPDQAGLQRLATFYAAAAESDLEDSPLGLHSDGELRLTALGKTDLASKIIAFTEQLVSTIADITSKDNRDS